MMSVRGYRWGAWLFGLAGLTCVALMPHAVQCCSRFAEADLRLRMEFGANGWSSGTSRVATALLDWPMGLRLLLMALVAAIVCSAATFASILIVRSEMLAAENAIWKSVVRGVLACLIVGVLYLLSIYATGFIGYLGPLNLLWMVAVPAAIALMAWPCPRGVLMTAPLAIGGWIALAAISIGLGIPID
jgi:hypothetical protein